MIIVQLDDGDWQLIKRLSEDGRTFFTALGAAIRYTGQAISTLNHFMYEPERFPGLIYRIAEPKVGILIFNSGKLVITGATDETQIPQAADQLHATLTVQHLLDQE